MNLNPNGSIVPEIPFSNTRYHYEYLSNKYTHCVFSIEWRMANFFEKFLRFLIGFITLMWLLWTFVELCNFRINCPVQDSKNSSGSFYIVWPLQFQVWFFSLVINSCTLCRNTTTNRRILLIAKAFSLHSPFSYHFNTKEIIFFKWMRKFFAILFRESSLLIERTSPQFSIAKWSHFELSDIDVLSV